MRYLMNRTGLTFLQLIVFLSVDILATGYFLYSAPYWAIYGLLVFAFVKILEVKRYDF